MIRAFMLAALALACVFSPAMAMAVSPLASPSLDVPTWLLAVGMIAFLFAADLVVTRPLWSVLPHLLGAGIRRYALVLALILIGTPAMAMGANSEALGIRYDPIWSALFWLLAALCAIVAVAYLRIAFGRGSSRGDRWVYGSLGALMLLAAGPALAANEIVAVSPTVVSAEWGPYLEVVLRWLSDAAVPLLTALIGGYLFRTYPMLRMILSEQIIESTLSKWADYGINATAGAAKGKTLDVNVGSEALANMLRRGQERASASNVSAWVMKAGGGPEEVAKKLFRKLTLEADASGADVLPKALEKAGVVPAAPKAPGRIPPPSARELRDADEMTRR